MQAVCHEESESVWVDVSQAGWSNRREMGINEGVLPCEEMKAKDTVVPRGYYCVERSIL